MGNKIEGIREFVRDHAPLTDGMISLKDKLHLSPLDLEKDGILKTTGKVIGLAVHLIITAVACLITVPFDAILINGYRGCRSLIDRVKPKEESAGIMLPDEILHQNAEEYGIVCIRAFDPGCPFSLTAGVLSAEETPASIQATMKAQAKKARTGLFSRLRGKKGDEAKQVAGEDKKHVSCMLDALKIYTNNALGNTTTEIIIKTFGRYVEGEHMQKYLRSLVREDGQIAGLYFYGGESDEERELSALMTETINNILPSILRMPLAKVYEGIDDGELDGIAQKQAEIPYGYFVPSLMSTDTLVEPEEEDPRPLSPVGEDVEVDLGRDPSDALQSVEMAEL